MILMKPYKTKTGRPGVICVCERRVLLASNGTLYMHSPLRGYKETPWCPYGREAPI